jgi:hypothetical protein
VNQNCRRAGTPTQQFRPDFCQCYLKNSQAPDFARQLRRKAGPISQENTHFCAVSLRFGDRACDCAWQWRLGMTSKISNEAVMYSDA